MKQVPLTPEQKQKILADTVTQEGFTCPLTDVIKEMLELDNPPLEFIQKTLEEVGNLRKTVTGSRIDTTKA